MMRIFNEMFERPLAAFASSMEMLGQRAQGMQSLDGMARQIAHTLSRASVGGSIHKSDATTFVAKSADLTEQDRLVLQRVDSYLSSGLALKRWWDKTYPANGFRQQFELQRVFNRPGRSFGFFDEVSFDGRTLPVMGNFQDMFYDRPRTPTNLQQEAAQWMRDQIREFVLHYFMRVSSFRQPEASVESGRPAPPLCLEGFSWCTEQDILRQGFGFSQLYYKLRDNGQVGKFQDEFAIIDLRELGRKYEWIVVRVRIFDFNVKFNPLGPDGPELAVPLKEESYLVLTRDFILNEDHPSPGVLGQYGLGYAFIKNPTQGLFAYGPGQFDAAIELINFQVLESGEVRVRMTFVVNRPQRIANVSLDPVNWGFRFADLFSFGLTSRLLAPVKDAFERLPTSVGSFDPVSTYVSLVNALTGNWAGRELCISREQLEKEFLAQHFMQHYTTIVGSLLTWRQIPDWLDSARLPEWVVTGRSS